MAGYGSTETCAATTVVHWPGERAGLVGLPQPGVTIKLVPLEDDRYEVRVKGPSVMPGYLDQPELTSSVFDDEGYYCMGDAVTFVDRSQPDEGLAFAGRVAEEFKLQSGIFVRVGSLRIEVINAAAPLLNDVVVAGADREYVALMAWPNPVAIRERFGIADAMFAPVCVRFRGYGVPLAGAAADYVAAMYELPAMSEWLMAGRAESERVAHDEA